MFSGERNFKTELSFQEDIVYLKKLLNLEKKRIQLKLLVLKNRDLSKLSKKRRQSHNTSLSYICICNVCESTRKDNP